MNSFERVDAMVLRTPPKSEISSGGRSIAKKVAETLDIPYYDKELIKQVAEKTGLSPDYVENAGEYAAGKSMLSHPPSLAGQHNFTNWNERFQSPLVYAEECDP